MHSPFSPDQEVKLALEPKKDEEEEFSEKEITLSDFPFSQFGVEAEEGPEMEKFVTARDYYKQERDKF